jgi:pimeloyl-ACP methyl ester carboxylesterase
MCTLASGRLLAYMEYGDPEGTPLLYFHGWPGCRLQGELFHHTGLRLGLRIIAPDRPGLGKSDFQPGRQLLDWPADMTELTAHLGIDRYYTLGISGGGPYVLAMVATQPERILGAAVICGAPPLREVGTQELMWTYKLALWGQQHTPLLLAPGLAMAAQFLGLPPGNPAVRTYLAKLCARDQLAMSDPDAFRIMTSAGRESLRSGARAVSADGNIYNSDWGIDPGRVTLPIHYWHGDQDHNLPLKMVERFVARLPSARLTVLPGEGHYSLPILCSPHIVEEMLRQNSGSAAGMKAD